MENSEKPLRKTVEKNRRIVMKQLYSELHSLLPDPPLVTTTAGDTRAKGSLPDRLDDAANYIKALEEKVEGIKEKKKQLLGNHGEGSSSRGGLKLPEIDVQDSGEGLQVVMSSSPGDLFVFNEAIRVCQNEGAEIVNANFSVAGDQAFHIIHAVKQPNNPLDASKLLERLKKEIQFVS